VAKISLSPLHPGVNFLFLSPSFFSSSSSFLFFFLFLFFLLLYDVTSFTTSAFYIFRL